MSTGCANSLAKRQKSGAAHALPDFHKHISSFSCWLGRVVCSQPKDRDDEFDKGFEPYFGTQYETKHDKQWLQAFQRYIRQNDLS